MPFRLFVVDRIFFAHYTVHMPNIGGELMPRTSKCRRVCALPPNAVFTPEHTPCAYVVLTVEQVEALRLCDLEGFDQDKAAEQMQISRGTLQRIVYSARRQMADALVHGKGIRIEGGHYQLHRPDCRCQSACQFCKLPHSKENKENEVSQHE